jgi:hypothetical protein
MPFKVGFWKTSLAEECLNCADPDWKTTHEFEYKAVLAYLDFGMDEKSYKGSAKCRICGAKLGSSDMLTPDMKWRFPEKFQHYITKHDVVPPSEPFIDSAVRWYRSFLKQTEKPPHPTERLVVKRYGRR